jgi:P4 family phage/plasmid primase-like protien
MSRLDRFLNGNPQGATDDERRGRKVTETGKPFTLWSFDNKQKWFITSEDQDEFYRLYCADLRNGTPRFFTERSTRIGHLRVDLDFKYDGQVDEHKHSQGQVLAFITAYMTEVKKYLKVPESVEIYVLEKDYPTYDPVKKVSSSGIHIQVPGLNTRASVEQAVRRALVRRMDEFFPNLGTNKDWDDVYDKSALTHSGNWPLLGSKKPAEGSLPYMIRYVVDWDSATGEMSLDNDINPTPTVEMVRRLSVRAGDDTETALTEFGEQNARAPPPETVPVVRGRSTTRGEPGAHSSRGSSPGRQYIEPLSETRRKYIYNHTMNLKKDRYINYADWVNVGICLKNIHPELEDVWVDFSEQINSERPNSFKQGECLSKWQTWGFRVEGERLSIKSLLHWSREDNPDGYKRIESENVDSLVDESVKTGTDYDIALVVHALFRDEFKCSSYGNNDWYHYVGHIWKNSEKGVELIGRLSSKVANIYLDKETHESNNIRNVGQCDHKDNDPTCPSCQAEKRKKEYSAIRLKLKKTSVKDSIMKECKVLFFDADFANKLDDNKHLIAFNDGVFDTLTQTFRDGRPEDCISFCTKMDFGNGTRYDEYPCWPELHLFLQRILPNPNVRDYFLKHLATCLSGVFHPRFHIMTGNGSNGKSMLMNLMATAMGDYCYKVNIAMFTQKRGKAGSAAPELIRMRGRRFVMMSEPDEGDPLSTGILKELTSAEKVSGRDLYAGSKQMIEFDLHAKFHLACNDKPTVNTTDGGTWRRLKVIHFPSKFVHEPRGPHEYMIDESIQQKVLSAEWATCFLSYLVHLYTEGKGLAKLAPPKEVEGYTSEYQEESDVIARFFTEYVHPLPEGQAAEEAVTKKAIADTFREWKRSNELGYRGSPEDVIKRVESQFGAFKRGGWTNFKLGIDG